MSLEINTLIIASYSLNNQHEVLLLLLLYAFSRVIFGSAMMVSATSLVQERREGILDRTYVAGQELLV